LREKIVFSWLAMYGAYFLLGAFSIAFSLFLNGNAMGETFVGKAVAESLPDMLRRHFPPYGARFIFKQYGLGSVSGTAADIGVNIWLLLIIWLFLAAAVSVLALRAFDRYKAENAGMQGVYPKLINIVTVLLTFTLYGINDGPGNNTRSNLLVIVLSVVWLFMTFIIIRLILTKSVRKVFNKEGLVLLGYVIALYGVTALCGLTGGFGYSSRQPKLNDIESAEMTYAGAPDFIPGNGDYYPVYTEFFQVPHSNPSSYNPIREYSDLVFTSEKDIKIILSLHKELIDAGMGFAKKEQIITDPEKDRVQLRLHVRYNLKNGKTVDRVYYSVPASLAADMLELDETDKIRERASEATALAFGMAERGDFPLYITDMFFGNEHKLAEEDQLRFLSALQKDIDGLQTDEKYFPGRPARAVVRFPRLVREGDAVGIPVYPIERDNKRAVSVAEQTGINESLSSFSARFAADYWYQRLTQTIQIHITDGYVNTLAFLREKGICGFIDDDMPDTTGILSIRALRCPVNPATISRSQYFRSNATYEEFKYGAAAVIPPDKWTDILKRAKTHYYTSGGGYYLWVEMFDLSSVESVRTVILFVPEADAPSYIKGIA
jgi:ABC-2 type transport system permease protein